MRKNLLSSQVTKNFLALIILQIANYVFPLLAYPFLANYLGIKVFGEVIVIISILTMTNILTDFGFNLSATHKIALNKENQTFIAALIGNIFLIKALLGVLAILLALGYLFYFPLQNHSLTPISFSLIGMTIFVQSFQCVWFFQGIERMKSITIATVSSKTIYIVLLAALLPNWATLDAALFCYAISQSVLVALYIWKIYQEGYTILPPNLKAAKQDFSESIGFFFSRVAVSVYTTVNTLIIGQINGSSAAGLYSSAEKLYQAGSSLSAMVSQVLYPYMGRNRDLKLLLKVTALLAIPYFTACWLVSFWTDEIIVLIFGQDFQAAGELLKLFLALMCISFVSMNIGYPGFAALNKVQYANYTVTYGAMFHLIGIFALFALEMVSPKNLLCLVIATESLILLTRITLLYRFSRKAKELI